MEELLNKLIEKGWKPRGEKIYNGIEVENYSIIFQCYDNKDKYIGTDIKSIRTLVSKESGLWQFVCENGMIEKSKNIFENYGKDDYEYRIIQSALCDEDKLEQFLLYKIKVE